MVKSGTTGKIKILNLEASEIKTNSDWKADNEAIFQKNENIFGFSIILNLMKYQLLMKIDQLCKFKLAKLV